MDLEFADDIAILAEEENICQQMTTKLDELSAHQQSHLFVLYKLAGLLQLDIVA